MAKYAIYSKDGFMFNVIANSEKEALESVKVDKPEAERAEFISDEDLNSDRER